MSRLILNFAHRGSLTEAPENTLAAMKKALEHGTKAIELDVQLTKDGELVVIHDHIFTRFNKDIPGQVNDYTLKEIQTFDIGSVFSEAYKAEKVPSLEEVLQIIPDDILLNVEIKNLPIIHEGIEQKVVDTLLNHNRIDNSIVSSFDHLALQKTYQINNNVSLGLLLSQRLINPWDYAKQLEMPLVSIHPLFNIVTKEFVEKCHEQNLKIYPYTVDQMDDYNQLIEYGVDGVFTNNPHIFKTNSK